MPMTETRKPASWPRGAGSLQWRGQVIWLIYTDGYGNKVQTSSGTTDFAAARRILTKRAISALEIRIERLKEFLDETPAKAAGGARRAAGPGDEQAQNRGRSAGRGRLHGESAADSGRDRSRKEGRA